MSCGNIFVVSLYKAQNEHSNHVDGNRGLSMVAREMVRQLFEDGNGCSVEDTPFVLGVNVEVDDGDKHDLKIVISTKRLLRLMIKTEEVQTDATYKLIWQGYPVLIVGSSDMNRTFHPFAIAVCNNETESDFAFIFNCVEDSCYKINETEWNPKILLADASSAITNGFKAVFGFPFRRLMCYFHVVKNIDGKLRGIQDKDEIRNNIECLHLCPDDEAFNIVSELFLKKWKEKK
ncbi:hypothetical protein AVEN_65045-1 [Araneus ventricosus]|uniref:MULE transposase domain-containing protein n=1 Tax=Araneus ventricosus TaxID=182803 RepID=A0A4Y2QQU1_ARAVE|nr:hypothetical protein AVEN_65045-1 [Araneus ventricosus]